MATTVVKTIGTGGDYTTLQAWEDACPASLVAVDQVWQGKVKNQEFSSASSLLTISGTTVDATRYVELTTDTGASFVDNASVRTNALRYNEANGAAIRMTGAWTSAINVNQSYTRISKIQVNTTSNTSYPFACGVSGGVSSCDINQCIFEGYSNGGVISLSGGHSLRNSLVVQKRATSAQYIAQLNSSNTYNCTFVSLVSTATNGFYAQYGTGTIKNCYIGGATTLRTGSTTETYTNNATSIASPPAGWTGSVALSTANFENVTSGTHDLRLKAGSALIDAGATESTYAPNDISGTARSGTWDIGAWEVSSGSALNITGTLGTATASGFVTTVDQQRAIAATLGAATASGYPATVDQQRIISASLGVAAASGLSASIDQQKSISASLGQADASGFPATVDFSGALNISATTGTASASGFIAVVDQQITIAASVGAAAADGFTASIQSGAPLFTSEELAFLLAYMQENLVIPTAAEIADAVWTKVLESGLTAAQMQRIQIAALAGTSEKTGSTIIFKGVDGTTDRIIGSFDAEHNRTGALLNGN